MVSRSYKIPLELFSAWLKITVYGSIGAGIRARIPYHVTRRGNHGTAIFFDDEYREVYMALLAEFARRYGLKLWAIG